MVLDFHSGTPGPTPEQEKEVKRIGARFLEKFLDVVPDKFRNKAEMVGVIVALHLFVSLNIVGLGLEDEEEATRDLSESIAKHIQEWKTKQRVKQDIRRQKP